MNVQRVRTPAWTRRPRTVVPPLILIHATRGDTTMARQFQATVNWFTNPPKYGDARNGFWSPTSDVLIGAGGEVVEFFTDAGDWRTSHSTWSAGYGAGGFEWSVDEVALAIELAQPAKQEPYTRECIDALVDYLRPVVRELGIPLERVRWWDQDGNQAPPRGFIGHEDTDNGRKTGKSDPGPLFPWDELLTRLADDGSHADELPDVPPQEVPMQGKIHPVVIHFGATPPQVERMLAGFRRAMTDVQKWFAREIGDGRTISFLDPVAVDASKQGKTVADFRRDAWGSALGAATAAGLPVWQDGHLVAVLVDKIPYTTEGLGGASPSTTAGVMVKDGDALELFARHQTGEPHDAANYDRNLMMLAHELLHGMHANDHEDVDGPNVEHEWWAGLVADLAPVNRAKLLASDWLTPESAPAPSTPPPDVVDEQERLLVSVAIGELEQLGRTLEQLRAIVEQRGA
ncbi:MAG: N-acetylmuramoyl-L-alanine amidase [Dehalococcoidia bacterium]